MNTPSRQSPNKSVDQTGEALQGFIVNDDEVQALRGLKTALRDLPQAEVPENASWEQVLQRLDEGSSSTSLTSKQRKASKGWLSNNEWLGIAAALLVVVSVVLYQSPLNTSPPATQPIAQSIDQADNQLQQWVARSQQLENAIRVLRQQDSGQVLSGSQAVATDELERMIGFVDLQLAASEVSRNPREDNELVSNERTGLWQQRVALLNELLVNQYGGRYGDFIVTSNTDPDAETANLLNQQI